jgi:hypothetical protein
MSPTRRLLVLEKLATRPIDATGQSFLARSAAGQISPSPNLGAAKQQAQSWNQAHDAGNMVTGMEQFRKQNPSAKITPQFSQAQGKLYDQRNAGWAGVQAYPQKAPLPSPNPSMGQLLTQR